jgi:hypothetical protein
MIRAPFILAKAGGTTAALMLCGWQGTKLSTCMQWIPTTPAKRTLAARRIQAALDGRPIPQDKREARTFRKMVYANITASLSDCRRATDWRGQDGLEALNKLERIASYAWRALCDSYNGDA